MRLAGACQPALTVCARVAIVAAQISRLETIIQYSQSDVKMTVDKLRKSEQDLAALDGELAKKQPELHRQVWQSERVAPDRMFNPCILECMCSNAA